MKKLAITLFLAYLTLSGYCKDVIVESPNGTIKVELSEHTKATNRNIFFTVSYASNGEWRVVIPEIKLGILRDDKDFSDELSLMQASEHSLIFNEYIKPHGKKSYCENSANEVRISLENPDHSKLNVILRVYNDGLAFRYEFPESEGTYTILDEFTSFEIPENTHRWLERFDLSNENLYTMQTNDSLQGDWCYPALFHSKGADCWYLIHEADLDRNYCATKLNNSANKREYKITLPYDHEGVGEANPVVTLPWESPWRVIILGDLADLVESTLIEDVSKPSVIEANEWIKPGKVSWNYWSNNHGTKDYEVVCEFTDLAAAMDWPYTLFDWEWDAMENGGDVEDAAKYSLSKGVKPLIWYNSGMFKWIQATPVDRMKTHESRTQEFAKLKEMGFVGVKIDFFLSEKQEMIDYYLDILEDAAEYEMMVYFHGCLVPRGWSRTYPHAMTYEAVRGAEWYNNNSELTTTAPVHNTVLPFTRNVVGSMDYTPVTFTNSQYPHITSYGHELALGIVFESALQHMADRPEGYYSLPDGPKTLLKIVPSSWDNTKFIDGYPGEHVVIARKKHDEWYLGGLNAQDKPKDQTLEFKFLDEGVNYKLMLITDGEHDKDLHTEYTTINKNSSLQISVLPRGGFAAYLKPIL